MKVFVFDTSICNGCYCCQIACKDEHCGNDWTPYAKPQPETGQFWLKLTEHVRGTVPKVKVHYVARLCNHCDAPVCLDACGVEGAIYKREDGLVVIDPEACTGCTNCALACPYGVIYMNDSLHIAQKCTGCAHLLDAGWKEPRCVDACPTGALKFLEESEAAGIVAGVEVPEPDRGLSPRVYYRNLPKKFIAGTVYDPVKKEVIRGATCTLRKLADVVGGGVGSGDGGLLTVRTDGFGDFWFEGLEVATYSLEIAADGFTARSFAGLNTERDINLGDIALGQAP
jgi:Fe-S-cluster-containing dehydrogenase component